MHKCVRCGSTYADNDESILRGCVSCGSIFFLFLKDPEDVVKAEEIQRELEAKNTTFEQELAREIEIKKSEIEKPISVKQAEKRLEKATRRFSEKKFGIETVKKVKEGVYEINLKALMENNPVIVLEKNGVYFIHLQSVFERYKK